jgi:hypothetical protein
MKKFIILLGIFINIQHTEAQVCGLSLTPTVTVAYVFSERNDLSMLQIFGESIPPGLVNIIRINTPESKQNVDNMVFSGQTEGVFIFPGATENQTIRFCSSKEYATELRRIKEDNKQ